MNHQCVSEHYPSWVLGIMIYKGILLLFGVFLAWETRKVHYAELNDSKNIGVAVYNILLFSVLSITTEFVLSNFLAKRIFNNSLIFVCTTLVLGLVFLPKVWRKIFPKICIDLMYKVSQVVPWWVELPSFNSSPRFNWEWRQATDMTYSSAVIMTRRDLETLLLQCLFQCFST